MSQSATFNDDPFKNVENPNDYLNLDSLLNENFDDPLKSIRLNVSNNASFNENENFSAGASLQLNRKLNDEGRNVTLLGRINYSDSESDSYSESFTQYYKENENGHRGTASPFLCWKGAHGYGGHHQSAEFSLYALEKAGVLCVLPP